MNDARWSLASRAKKVANPPWMIRHSSHGHMHGSVCSQVMATKGMLSHALAPSTVLVNARGGVDAAERGAGSIKAVQC